jgi:hypothetical protein
MGRTDDGRSTPRPMCVLRRPLAALLALEENAYSPGGAYPLGVLYAQIKGIIGYMIEQYWANPALPRSLHGHRGVAQNLPGWPFAVRRSPEIAITEMPQPASWAGCAS